jgi:hypothetical protein
MDNSQHVDCLRGKTSSANTRFCPRKPIPPPKYEPAWWEADGDTRAAAEGEGNIHDTNPRIGTPRNRELKHQATVDSNQRGTMTPHKCSSTTMEHKKTSMHVYSAKHHPLTFTTSEMNTRIPGIEQINRILDWSGE